MEADKLIFTTGATVNAADLGATEKWHFIKVTHLRLRDHSLLKFAPGVRDVPTSLAEAEKQYLIRNGASPVDSKQASNEAQSGAGEPQESEGASGATDTGDGPKEDSATGAKVSKAKK